jgi:phosphatidylglycerophosphatase A
VHLIACGFGAGMAPAAPGTWGTLVAVPFYFLLLRVAFGWRLTAVLGAFLFGIWVCGESARRLGVHDPSSIVLDEIVAFLLVMVLLPAGWPWLVAGFVVFRVMDILKPWPIRRVDRRMTSGLGIMLDDILAGLLTTAVLWIVYAIWLWAR